MDKTVRITFIVGLFISLVFLYGFKTISRAIKNSGQHISISTTGSAEKAVRADIAEVKIVVNNKDEDFSKLYNKRVADKQKVLDFLKTCGIDDEDVVSVNINSRNKGEKGAKISHQEKYFASEDTIFIRTKNFDGVENLKNQIIQLASQGVIASYKCVYKILNLEDIKAELMADAAKNSEKNANILLAPFNKKVKKLLSIHNYSNLSVKEETAISRWETTESSPTKKVKVNVSASFSYE